MLSICANKGAYSIPQTTIGCYSTQNGNVPVQEYIATLAKKHKDKDIAAIRSYIKRLEQYGLRVNDYHHETIKHLRDGIYELRPTTTRIFFFCYVDDNIVLLHAIEKKRMSVPTREIEKAIKEKKDYIRRNDDGKGNKL